MKPTPDEARTEIVGFLDHLLSNRLAMYAVTERQKDYIVMFRDYLPTAAEAAVEDMLTHFPSE